MKAGVIGCGFIGTEVAEFIDKDSSFNLIGINDIDKNKADELIKKLIKNKPLFMDLNDLIKNSDLIIESATKNIIEPILKNENLDKKGKKLLIMSTGGLINNLDLLGKEPEDILSLGEKKSLLEQSVVGVGVGVGVFVGVGVLVGVGVFAGMQS